MVWVRAWSAMGQAVLDVSVESLTSSGALTRGSWLRHDFGYSCKKGSLPLQWLALLRDCGSNSRGANELYQSRVMVKSLTFKDLQLSARY